MQYKPPSNLSFGAVPFNNPLAVSADTTVVKQRMDPYDIFYGDSNIKVSVLLVVQIL